MGNLEMVKHLALKTNINEQHKMNGFTALHWACIRGHYQVAKYLLSLNAQLLKDSKGRTPEDVATGECLSLFDKQVQPVEVKTFVPNYIQHPELDKLWSKPEQAVPNSSDSRQDTRGNRSADVFQVVLYYCREHFDQQRVLGACFVEKASTLDEFKQQVELEHQTTVTSMHRVNPNGLHIPISPRQYVQNSHMHLKDSVCVIINE